MELSNLSDDRFALKTILHVLVFFALFVVANVFGQFLHDQTIRLLSETMQLVAIVFFAVLKVAAFICFAGLYSAKVLKRDLAFFRIPSLSIGIKWLFIAFLLPLSIISIYIMFTDIQYFEHTTQQETALIVENILISVFSIGFTAAVTEEILFRGFLMRLLENRWNIAVGVWVPSLVFGLLHLFNIPSSMEILDIVLLAIAGTSVGIMFSLVAFCSGNVWNSVVIHMVWNCLIVGRIIDISTGLSEQSTALFRFNLLSDSFLWSGGNFGIESGLPATLGYLLVIAVTLFTIQRRNGRI